MLAVILVVLVVLILSVIFLMNVLIPLKNARRYIIMELERSYGTGEQAYWEKELKHLYRDAIPFYYLFSKKKKERSKKK